MINKREQYFGALGFNPNSAAGKSKLEKALVRAYELRSFEIEHLWKRATYFWGFQIAIFAAFGLIWKDSVSGNTSPWSPVTVALSGLGVLTACANYISAKGSRFWQRNWELHVDMLENEIEGSLYKTVWLDEGKPDFSVSKVNQRLNEWFIAFWGFVTFYVASKFTCLPPLDLFSKIPPSAQFVLIISTVLFGVWSFLGEKSKFDASLPTPDLMNPPIFA